jgi:SAM-dependent methyltransferase
MRDERGGISQWSDQGARDFCARFNTDYAFKLIDLLCLNSGQRVLDLGCGPGNLTLLMAQSVGEVVSVDCSQSMLAVLRERQREVEAANVSCVHSFWRDVRVGIDIKPPFDLAVCSNSFELLGAREARDGYGQVDVDWDLTDAVRLMNQVARKVVITMPLSESSLAAVLADLGQRYDSFPGYRVVREVLLEMGCQISTETILTRTPNAGYLEHALDMLDRVETLSPLERESAQAEIRRRESAPEAALQTWAVCSWCNDI